MAEKKTYTGRAYEAWCVDCNEALVTTDLAEAKAWLENHRKEMGHRG